MRIALDSGNDIGKRAARIFLGDSRCTHLTLLNGAWVPRDRRVTVSPRADGADVVVSDGSSSHNNLVAAATAAGAPLVLWPDTAIDRSVDPSFALVVGANVGSSLVHALAVHPVCRASAEDIVTVAWTEPGTPKREGHAVSFPDPVGMTWSEEREDGSLVAYRDDEWAAATSIAEGPSGRRVVGVADLGSHLEALTLAAVAFAAANGTYPVGVSRASSQSAAVLNETKELELDIAVWQSAP